MVHLFMLFHPHIGSIGVFDSGFGGLDVLRGIVNSHTRRPSLKGRGVGVKKLSQYDYVYLGDSARSPDRFVKIRGSGSMNEVF